MRIYLLALCLVLPTAADAQSMEMMTLANELGSVLGAEEQCGLSYNQAAIESFINEKVPADDMSFASSLSLMTEGAKYQLEEMSKSSLTAHCAQTRRVAKSYGFTE